MCDITALIYLRGESEFKGTAIQAEYVAESETLSQTAFGNGLEVWPSWSAAPPTH